MTRSVFDRMAAARAQALVLRRNPVGWKVNEIALTDLRKEGTLDDSQGQRPLEDVRLFGLPVILDSDDRSTAPLFWLLVDKSERTDQAPS